ncbi:hypothetical protein H0H93_013955 [Arthromyces matolae]|nr:hypothetical protein H0H93_013955 [Arthromyces matolae]
MAKPGSIPLLPALPILETNRASAATTTITSDANIDPELRHAQFKPEVRNGVIISKLAFASQLENVLRRRPLQEACSHFGVHHARQANLKKLRAALVSHWYSDEPPNLPSPAINNSVPTLPQVPHTATPTTRSDNSSLDLQPETADDLDLDDDALLLKQYGPAAALGSFDDGYMEGEEDEEDGEDPGGVDVDMEPPSQDNLTHEQFKRKVRIGAAQDSELNRRAGGIKTQKGVLKCWKIFVDQALAKGEIHDDIVDEHSLLLFLNYSATRCRRTSRGEDIPETRIGALIEFKSQIKKEFFGVLRIRSEQEAADPTLATTRPGATVYVYRLAKTRMDEALQNAYTGLIKGDDAPDVVANTFLEQLPQETLDKIGIGFLSHRELKSAINGHLAWNMMNSSGNRGDDIRSLRLCEMQPYTFLHPDGVTLVPAVLGLQSASKASVRRGMKTTVNPTYTCFIAARDPYINEKYRIDYTVNKSWRAIHLIHGSSAVVPYNEHALQNLFVQSYKKAGVESRLKAHLARHMLGYQQEKMGVDESKTAKLGWSRDTYSNTYAPALPKSAILGAHGYKVSETYNPVWRHVRVPEKFLELVCPMAEENLSLVEGKRNLVGATNYWKMIITLRPFLFQSAAAIFQITPDSAIFRLPALTHPDVRVWMTTTFPAELAALNAAAGDPIDLARIQDATMRAVIEEMRRHTSLQATQLHTHSQQISALTQKIDRRTAQWSPPKAAVHYPSSALPAPSFPSSCAISSPLSETVAPTIIDTQNLAAVSYSDVPQPCQSSIDLVLPGTIAFCAPGDVLLAERPIFSQHAPWAAVFDTIRQPSALWEAWKPNKTLDQMSIVSVWDCYNTGEAVYDIKTGNQMGVKPPLRLVEQRFRHEWRKTSGARKTWERFREIPEWIDTAMRERGLTSAAAIKELEARRSVPGRSTLLGTNALASQLACSRKADAKKFSLSNTCIKELHERRRSKARPFIVGVNIHNMLDNCVVDEQNKGSSPKLQIFFDRLCEFLTAPAVFVFVDSGKDGTSAAQRKGKKVMILVNAFGYRYHQAPGEAEAELAWLKSEGLIDAIAADNGDTLIFDTKIVTCRFSNPVDTSRWILREPVIAEITVFCHDYFGWSVPKMRSTFHSKLWRGVLISMLSSKYVVRDEKKLNTPFIGTTLLSIKQEGTRNGMAEVTISTSGFVALMGIVNATASSLVVCVPESLLRQPNISLLDPKPLIFSPASSSEALQSTRPPNELSFLDLKSDLISLGH